MRLRFLPLLSAGLAAAAGCGGSNLPRFGTLKGVVKLDGKPLPGGSVQMVNAANTFDGFSYINENGEYLVRQVPAGQVLVSVTTEDVKNLPSDAQVKAMQARGIPIVNPADPKVRGTKYVAIPAKYRDKATSGLTAEVKPDAETVHDIELKSK
jgi:hypothetical protein